MKYKDFNDWFFEGEEYSMRCERFFGIVDNAKTELALETNMVVWLKAAFEAAREETQ